MAANPLNDLIPARARKYVYGVILLAALVFGAWQAAEGNIEVFVGSLITALVNALALSNTPSDGNDEPEAFDFDHPDNYYDGHGA